MLIIEGPDGSGKTTLIKKLQFDLNLPLHKRFCNSDGSPTQPDPRRTDEQQGRDGLFYHAFQDTATLDAQPMSIYDRHTMVSEYVYGPIVRGELPREFDSPSASRMIHLIASRSLLVMCKPPIDRLIASVAKQTHMDGVVERIRSIKAAYDALYVFWPGEKIEYNFAMHTTTYDAVLYRARLHIAVATAQRESK